MVQYKLNYFNTRGRAELARLVFAAAGQQYEDTRFEREQWPENKKRSPTGQAPFLEVSLEFLIYYQLQIFICNINKGH